ncbi:MAG: selenocysteine-specific translation elongation factor [Chitinivibrionales bacterium]|nr:selenocysteine-specific translation elongation factor [Chitinivibrionales bacterium]
MRLYNRKNKTSPMKHLIIGTAGHIDHGKTALIRALTGIECDTHPEEKRRGITINLGFAHLKLSDELTVGIIDVPGHKDFIHTMVSGACGIDLALLVISADGGVMPQTVEHCRIMNILGIGRGVIAVTRSDLADMATLQNTLARIKAFTNKTAMESWSVVTVSSITGQGIGELKAAIAQVAGQCVQRTSNDVFRLFIDRIFSVKGFGTVVAGSVLSGCLHTDASAFLLPPGRELRVRRCERYGEPVNAVQAGDRASLNVAGLDK